MAASTHSGQASNASYQTSGTHIENCVCREGVPTNGWMDGALIYLLRMACEQRANLLKFLCGRDINLGHRVQQRLGVLLGHEQWNT